MRNLFVMLLAVALVLNAQDKKKLEEEKKAAGPVLLLQEKQKQESEKWEMKQYFLVLLKKGPMRNQDSVTAAKLQTEHLANIERLYKEGKLDIAGPMGNDGDIRGIFIMNVSSFEEAKALCDTDPMIKVGRLVAEIYPWWAGKGAKLR